MDGRFAAAVIAGSLTLLPVGFLLYGVVFAFLFEEGALTLPGVMRQSPSIAWIVAGQCGFGTLLALVIRWRGREDLFGGAVTGALLGFLMAVGYDFAQYGTSNLWTLRATLVDPFVSALLVGSSGAVTGWVLGGRPGPAAERD